MLPNRVDWHITEGTTFEPVKHCATVHGPVRKILLGERVALNTLARCSGIATAYITPLFLNILLASALTFHSSAHFLSLLRQAGSTATLAGTRKTTPAFRVPEKYAMLVGGIDGHRHDLSSMIMLKDNHVWACGSITAAVQAAKAVGGFSMKVEVECQNEAEAIEAIAAGADVVMLDNFAASEVGRAVRNLKERFNGFSMDERSTTLERKEFLVEISGGITVENVKMLGDTGVDIVSTSAVHQGVKHLDFSLKIVH